MVRLEVSSSAAMASAVRGFRVRRSTWMIWNSRSARLMSVSFRALSDADRMLAAGGIYKGATHSRRGFCPMIIIYGYGLYTAARPLLTPWWQQGVNTVRRLIRKLGAAA